MQETSVNQPVDEIEETPIPIHRSFIQKIRSNPIFESWVPMVTVFVYVFYGLGSIVWYEITPLWMVLSVKEGGLGFSEREPGILAAITGVFVLLFQLFICARIMGMFCTYIFH